MGLAENLRPKTHAQRRLRGKRCFYAAKHVRPSPLLAVFSGRRYRRQEKTVNSKKAAKPLFLKY